MKRLIRIASIALALFALLILLVTPLSAQDEVVLTFGISSGVDTLDNTATTFSSVEIIVGHVFDTLVKQQPLGVYHSGLATDWTVSDDATEYTFNLRDDVTFHDGTAFNAEAVKYTFDRIVDPDTKSQMAFSFIGPYAESEVLSEYSIAVRFSSPNAAFLDGVSHPQLGPVSPAAVEALGADWGFSGIVGTGPFAFDSYIPDSEVVMVKNADYNWGNEDVFGRSGPPEVDRLIFKILTDPGTRLAALESGEVDMINGVPGLMWRASTKARTSSSRSTIKQVTVIPSCSTRSNRQRTSWQFARRSRSRSTSTSCRISSMTAWAAEPAAL